MADIKKITFGNVSGSIGVGDVLAIEFTDDFPKIISGIAASFRVPNGETKVTKPFHVGAVVVYRGSLAQLSINRDVLDIDQTQNAELLKFFNTYDGFTESVFIQTSKQDKLTIVLFPPYFEDDLTQPQSCFGSLTVFGSFAQDKPAFEVL